MTASVSESRTNIGPARRRAGFVSRLFEAVPIAPLVQFRVALGLILLWEAYRYVSANWHRTLFLDRLPETPELDPPYLFHYYGFEWVRPLPEPLHVGLFYVLALLAVCVAVGLFSRVAAVLLFFGWAYVFLLDQALYLNHLYLVILITGLAALLPANRALSLDVRMRPGIASDTAPRWTLSLLRAQVGLVYFFGGVAKLNADWLSGVPMQLMLLERADLLGQTAGEPWAALALAYGGLLLDLFIVPILWWRKTRLVGLLLVAGFHMTNDVLFRIGIFPWFMLAATLILWPPYRLSLLSFLRIFGSLVLIRMGIKPLEGSPFPPPLPFGLTAAATIALPLLSLWKPARWPGFVALVATQLFAFAWTWRATWPAGASSAQLVVFLASAVGATASMALVLGLAYLLLFPPGWLRDRFALRDPAPGAAPTQVLPRGRRAAVLSLLALYLGWQFVMPLRHFLYPGDPSWTEQGHKWSWHMKLRIKHTAYAAFFVYDGDGQLVDMVFPFNPDGPLTFRQARTMTTRPDLILQFAHHLRDESAGRVKGPVKVTATIHASLNGRPPQDLVDPEADLAAVEPRLWPPAEWILPLDTPRPDLVRVDVRPFAEGMQGPPPDPELDEL